MPGLYIHIPFCRSKCRYCDFTSYPGKIGYAEAYMACVYKEMKLRAPELQNKEFDSIYFGGGTPSLLDAKWISGCMNRLRECYSISSDAEVTIEMNPGTVDLNKIAAYKKAGINRFSIGLQSSKNRILEEIGRCHTAKDFLNACQWIGKGNKSADILIGLKDQSWEDIQQTIDYAVSGGVSHISMYALTPEEDTPIYTDYLNGELPDEDTVADFYDQAKTYLSSLGFSRYEVSNFAKRGFESRHNWNYWRRGEYVGFGVAACSFFGNRRFTNTRDLDEYIKCILTDHYPVVADDLLSEEDAKFETVMLALRTAVGLDLIKYRKQFGTDFFVDFHSAIQKNSAYLEWSDNSIKIRDEYLYVQNTIIIDFLQI